VPLTGNADALLNDLNVRKLPHAAFRQALAEGRGTALMHVLVHGLAGVEQLVLAACLTEQAYDTQCEGHRASWLYRMFGEAPEYDLFSRRIIAELKNMSEDSSAEQLCELARMMAMDGDEEAKSALRSFVWGQDFTSGDMAAGCHAIALVDGLAAISEIARRYGRALLIYPHALVDSIEDLTDDPQACASAFAHLSRLAHTDAAIARYLERELQEMARCAANAQEAPTEKAARRERNRSDILTQFPLAEVFAAAERHENGKGRFLRFGRWSDDAARAAVLERLRVEPDIEVCLRLLWVFRRATPPLIPARLWDFAVHHDVRVRDAALTALGHVADRAVGEFGRRYLAERPFTADDASVIDLFSENYEAGDEDRIMQALAALQPDEEDAHYLGMSIRTFCNKHPSPGNAGMLHWLYRTNPCTLCRGDAIAHLAPFRCLSSDVERECRFDASEKVRALLRDYPTPVPAIADSDPLASLKPKNMPP
jgi:hypothetical protein